MQNLIPILIQLFPYIIELVKVILTSPVIAGKNIKQRNIKKKAGKL